MSVIVVIPARYNSVRFPGKALFEIKNKALIKHVYDNVILSKKIDHCVVATDNQLIMDYCVENNLNAQWTSDKHINGTERVAEVAKYYRTDDIIINIQGDEPLVDVSHIDKLIDILSGINPPDIATLGIIHNYNDEIDKRNLVKIVVNINSEALYFSRASIPFVAKNKPVGSSFIQHIGMYGFKANVLQELVKLPESTLEKIESLEQLRWLENGYKIGVGFTDLPLIGIDTKENVDELYAYWEELEKDR